MLISLRRPVEAIGWGVSFRDKTLIAVYYGLLVTSKPLRFGEPLAAGMHPEFWLGDVSIRTPIGRFSCRRGTSDVDIVNPNYESALVHAVREFLTRLRHAEAVFVDIGAHIGKYSVLAARTLAPAGTVLAVEPDPANYGALKKNLKLNGLRNVRAINVGCWSGDGVRILHRQPGNLGGHSFIDNTKGDSIPVPVKALDGILASEQLNHVDAMKLDVQRAEFEVLSGARATLESNLRIVVFFEESGDPHYAKSVPFLRQLGFNVRRLDSFNFVAQRPT